jgi:glycerate kinase
MQILIAPNAFKNSLTAFEAAEAIEEGLHQSGLTCVTECFPIADGGDGTAQLIVNKLTGRVIYVEVHDPLGRLIKASFGLIEDDKTAVIEMADASGLRLLKYDELNPLQATSFGTGEMIKAALEMGVNKILIAMGGSATVDGGTGILLALGARFLDKENNELIDPQKNLVNLNRVNCDDLDPRAKQCEIVVLCDVDNQLLGDQGAAAIFGPQKGADAKAVKLLDAGLAQFNDVTIKDLGIDLNGVKYSGAAGGASAGVYAYLNAKLVNGIDYFLELTRFSDSLAKSDLLITGEGSIDEQTLNGKGPFGVAVRAKAEGIPVIGFAGRVPLKTHRELKLYFPILLSIGNGPSDLQTSIANTKRNLIRISLEVGNILHARQAAAKVK